MNEEQKQKGNQIIRKFMRNNSINVVMPFTYDYGEEGPTTGNVIENYNDAITEVEHEISDGIIDVPYVECKDYHNSWDMLMPVVDKCTQVGWRDQDEDSPIYEKFCALFMDNCSMFLGNHIEEVWQTVVDFINLYNKNKSKWKLQ